jgi:hypothetical protein
MNFLTIGQYFNKLQSALLFILIVPLLIFTTLYLFAHGMAEDQLSEYYIVISAAVVLDWFMAVVIFNKKIKSARNQQGLGAKLDKYFKLTIVRYSVLSSASLLLAVGLYLSGSDVFMAMYMVGLLIAGILWPTSRRVSDDLKLRGDEREMVYYKKDTF